MNKEQIQDLLLQYKDDKLELKDVVDKLKTLPFEDLTHTKLDLHREIRNGYPEVIYGEGKSYQQLSEIVNKMIERKINVLATRINKEKGEKLYQQFKNSEYNETAKCFTYQQSKIEYNTQSSILIVTAGTSDLPVAEEAKVTANILGYQAQIISDVGVAGIHRLFAQIDIIRQAKVIIVIAGMEGALASVMGGLVDAPIIAVPTSIGYGANFGGISALLGMLSSCANGITVTNIDNGYGAAYAACKILNIEKQA